MADNQDHAHDEARAEARDAPTKLPPLRRLVTQYLLAVFVLPALSALLIAALAVILALTPLVISQIESPVAPVFPSISATLPLLEELLQALAGMLLAIWPLLLLPVMILAYHALSRQPGRRVRLYIGLTAAPYGTAIAVLLAGTGLVSVSASAVDALLAGVVGGGLFALATFWAYSRDWSVGCWYLVGIPFLLVLTPLGLSQAPFGIRGLAAGSGLATFLALFLPIRLRPGDRPMPSPYLDSLNPTGDEPTAEARDQGDGPQRAVGELP